MKKLFRNYGIILLFFASTLAVLFISLYSNSLMSTTTRLLETNTQQRLIAVAKSAAQIVTAEELDQFREAEDMQKPEYAALKEKLEVFSQDYDVLFTYYLRPYGDGQLQFVIDNDQDPETQVSLHDIVDMEPAPQDALGGVAATAGVGNYSINWDGILAAYAPVYDENGQVYCIAGVDMSDEIIVGYRDQARALIILQVICIVIALGSGFWALYLYRRKARQSESANLAKSQFLSRMSHEIRTPMNAVIGLCRMAKNSDDIHQVKGYLDNINTSSDHLLSLINDILDLSKIESGKVAVELVPVALAEEMETTVGIVMPQMEAKDQHFSLEMDEALPPYVFCDTTRLSQVLVNLLGNAIKFTPEGGQVTVAVKLLEARSGEVRIQWLVRDSGIGIEPEFLERLFEPFEQGDTSTTRRFGGTGLGLAIAKQLVEIMGGSIGARSTVGSGSEFYFDAWLRIAAESDVKHMARLTLNGDAPDLTGKRVLLVEDSDINQLIAENIFSGMGATVDIAENGEQGLQRFQKINGHYDLIFMDVQMPVMDGYEATRAIRTSGVPGASTVPIIAMTANVFREDIQRALDAGMNAHIGKPFEVEQVEQAIVQVLSEAS